MLFRSTLPLVSRPMLICVGEISTETVFPCAIIVFHAYWFRSNSFILMGVGLAPLMVQFAQRRAVNPEDATALEEMIIVGDDVLLTSTVYVPPANDFALKPVCHEESLRISAIASLIPASAMLKASAVPTWLCMSWSCSVVSSSRPDTSVAISAIAKTAITSAEPFRLQIVVFSFIIVLLRTHENRVRFVSIG
jgi:hypothetical protein